MADESFGGEPFKKVEAVRVDGASRVHRPLRQFLQDRSVRLASRGAFGSIDSGPVVTEEDADRH